MTNPDLSADVRRLADEIYHRFTPESPPYETAPLWLLKQVEEAMRLQREADAETARGYEDDAKQVAAGKHPACPYPDLIACEIRAGGPK